MGWLRKRKLGLNLTINKVEIWQNFLISTRGVNSLGGIQAEPEIRKSIKIHKMERFITSSSPIRKGKWIISMNSGQRL